MRILLLLFAATLFIGAAAAADHKAGTPEEAVPEEIFLQKESIQKEGSLSSIDAESELLEETYQEALDRVALVQVNRKAKDACIKEANNSIKSVIKEVKAAQRVLNSMDNGSRCAGKRSSEVQRAKASLANKKAAVNAAKAALNKATNARITVTVSYNTANNNCNTFLKSATWQKARRNVKDKKNKLTKAKQAQKDAEKYLVREEIAAKDARCKCKDRVTKAAQNALATAKKQTPDRKKSIIRESLVICLVQARRKGRNANSYANSCKKKGLASQYNSKLQLHQTKLVKMKFECNKFRGHGSPLKDTCKGFRISKHCGKGKMAIQVYASSTWSRYTTYSCPLGWYWPSASKWFSRLKSNGCYGNNAKSRQKGNAYYGRCGWSGYTPPSGNSDRNARYYVRFKDSQNGSCRYQHTGNNIGYSANTGCSTSNFAGIGCIKNGY